MMQSSIPSEIAQSAAAWVLEHGLDYGSAKRKARSALGLPDRSALPSNAELEAAMREHIDLYLSDTQPRELAAMRELALTWMQRLAPFRPYLCGGVWNGLATQQHAIYLQLFADDAKMVDIWLLNEKIAFDLTEHTGVAGKPVPTLVLQPQCRELGTTIPLALAVHEHDDLRQAKRLDDSGQPLRGDAQALRHRMGLST